MVIISLGRTRRVMGFLLRLAILVMVLAVVIPQIVYLVQDYLMRPVDRATKVLNPESPQGIEEGQGWFGRFVRELRGFYWRGT